MIINIIKADYSYPSNAYLPVKPSVNHEKQKSGLINLVTAPRPDNIYRSKSPWKH